MLGLASLGSVGPAANAALEQTAQQELASKSQMGRRKGGQRDNLNSFPSPCPVRPVQFFSPHLRSAALPWESVLGPGYLAPRPGVCSARGLMIVCPHEPNGEGDLSTPMEAEDYQEDGIANLWVVDRRACSVQNWQTNPFIPSTVPFTSTG